MSSRAKQETVCHLERMEDGAPQNDFARFITGHEDVELIRWWHPRRGIGGGRDIHGPERESARVAPRLIIDGGEHMPVRWLTRWKWQRGKEALCSVNQVVDVRMLQGSGGRCADGRLLCPVKAGDRRRVELGGEVRGAVLHIDQRYLAVSMAHRDDLACGEKKNELLKMSTTAAWSGSKGAAASEREGRNTVRTPGEGGDGLVVGADAEQALPRKALNDELVVCSDPGQQIHGGTPLEKLDLLRYRLVNEIFEAFWAVHTVFLASFRFLGTLLVYVFVRIALMYAAFIYFIDFSLFPMFLEDRVIETQIISTPLHFLRF